MIALSCAGTGASDAAWNQSGKLKPMTPRRIRGGGKKNGREKVNELKYVRNPLGNIMVSQGEYYTGTLAKQQVLWRYYPAYGHPGMTSGELRELAEKLDGLNDNPLVVTFEKREDDHYWVLRGSAITGHLQVDVKGDWYFSYSQGSGALTIDNLRDITSKLRELNQG